MLKSIARFSLIIFILVMTACVSPPRSKVVILDYREFGPQIIASEVIGMEWWQWNSHGDSRYRDYTIKVAVYRDISLEEVKTKYPVNSTTESDYRYLKHSIALEYLDKKITENVMKSVTQQLIQTREKLSLLSK